MALIRRPEFAAPGPRPAPLDSRNLPSGHSTPGAVCC